MYIYIYCFFCFFFLGGGGVGQDGSGKLGSGMLWFQVCYGFWSVCVFCFLCFGLVLLSLWWMFIAVSLSLSLSISLSVPLSLSVSLSLSHVAGAMQSNMLSCSRCDAIQHAASNEQKPFLF